MNELATTQNHAVAAPISRITFSPDQVDLIKRTICKGGTDDELALFLGQCQRTGLDPFAKQIHAVKRWNSKERREEMSIQVGIDGFRLIADRHRDDNGNRDYTGQVGPYWCGEDGIWKDVWLSKEPPSASKVGILRSGFPEPVFGVALFRSYAQVTKEGSLTRFWAQMGEVMIAKVAEALALRKAFPQDLSGLYTSDEMAQAENEPQLDRAKEVKPATKPTYISQEKAHTLARRANDAGFTQEQVFEAVGRDPDKVTPAAAKAFFAVVEAAEQRAIGRDEIGEGGMDEAIESEEGANA